ncbi:MAG: BPSS1780 family membrane protein [Rubrivivax sp.]|nr:BPSS1780 family membrane protein [Rubrivivax sp.]
MTLLLKTVPASRGLRWVVDAFRLFARKPLLFTMMFAVFLFAALVVSLVPLLGGLVQMAALPLLSLGFMIASQSALGSGPVHPVQFIEPLRGDPARRRSLLILCAIYGVSALAILLLADAVSDSAWTRLQALMVQGDETQSEIDALLAEPGVTTAVILALVLGTALSVPFWHAPALVHWGGQGVAQALFSSTLAVWRCKGAFFTYALAWAGVIGLFGLLAALLFGLLGMPQLANVLGVPAGLTFSTVFYISLLFTFTDSFGGVAPAPPGAAPGSTDG